MRIQIIVVIPELPGFAGDVKSDKSLKNIIAAQYRTINRGGNSIYEVIRKAGYEPCVVFFWMTINRPDVPVCLGWIISGSTTFDRMTGSTDLIVCLVALFGW